MKKIIYTMLIALLLGLGACTKDFEGANSNPYKISNKSLAQDYNNIGSYYATLLQYLMTTYAPQVEESEVYESWAMHQATPQNFNGGNNEAHYFPLWQLYWVWNYGAVMAPSQAVLKLARAGKYDVFTQWATLIRVMKASYFTALYGPIIYTKYGSTSASVPYDKESDLYPYLFSQLDSINTIFSANKTYGGLTKFDKSYGGNVAQWLKLANSIRLRLAIRISEASPALAKAQGEKAISDAGGLIKDNGDNFLISLYGGQFYDGYGSWGPFPDIRMSAAMESFLVGLKDPRLSVYFSPCPGSTDVSDHPAYPYKGIANGGFMGNSLLYAPVPSRMNKSFQFITSRRYLTAAEVYFDLAEASLRGWSGAGDAKTNYEAGVNSSFSDWGASGAASYLDDGTSTPINYKDPLGDDRNNFISRSNITVKWNEADSQERKLEKIITQKWINAFTHSLEAWVDIKRTGYPKLPFIADNRSTDAIGKVSATGRLQRYLFDPYGETTNNKAAVAEAASWLKFGDKITSPCWFTADRNVGVVDFVNFP